MIIDSIDSIDHQGLNLHLYLYLMIITIDFWDLLGIRLKIDQRPDLVAVQHSTPGHVSSHGLRCDPATWLPEPRGTSRRHGE